VLAERGPRQCQDPAWVETIFHIPLHLQVMPWDSLVNVELAHRADNWLEVRRIKIN
jgi:hypothetical protein